MVAAASSRLFSSDAPKAAPGALCASEYLPNAPSVDGLGSEKVREDEGEGGGVLGGATSATSEGGGRGGGGLGEGSSKGGGGWSRRGHLSIKGRDSLETFLLRV